VTAAAVAAGVVASSLIPAVGALDWTTVPGAVWPGGLMMVSACLSALMSNAATGAVIALTGVTVLGRCGVP
jgi:hypothetical protein